MRIRSTRFVIATTAMATAAVLMTTVLVAPRAWSVDQARQSDTTIATADDGGSSVGNILPRPNTGQTPDSPNDPGGWQQYLVFALIFAGLGAIVLLATRESRRARAERDHASTA
jgi:hypothetical protein